jgi:uracil DNA glycosylase
MKIDLCPLWKDILEKEFNKEYFKKIEEKIQIDKNN